MSDDTIQMYNTDTLMSIWWVYFEWAIRMKISCWINVFVHMCFNMNVFVIGEKTTIFVWLRDLCVLIFRLKNLHAKQAMLFMDYFRWW